MLCVMEIAVDLHLRCARAPAMKQPGLDYLRNPVHDERRLPVPGLGCLMTCRRKTDTLTSGGSQVQKIAVPTDPSGAGGTNQTRSATGHRSQWPRFVATADASPPESLTVPDRKSV